MDALVTDEGDPWNPNDKTVTAIDSLCTEALKVIKPGGALIQISFQQVRGGGEGRRYKPILVMKMRPGERRAERATERERKGEREKERECVSVGGWVLYLCVVACVTL